MTCLPTDPQRRSSYYWIQLQSVGTQMYLSSLLVEVGIGSSPWYQSISVFLSPLFSCSLCAFLVISLTWHLHSWTCCPPCASFLIRCLHVLQVFPFLNHRHWSSSTSSKTFLMDPHFGPVWITFTHAFAFEGEHDHAVMAYLTCTRMFTGWVFTSICHP